MSADFWKGLAVIPGFLVFAAVSFGLAVGAVLLWNRFTPPHWSIAIWQRRARPAHELFRWTEVAGGHAKTLRRLVRFGPYGLYVIRYAPGDDPAEVDRREKEATQ